MIKKDDSALTKGIKLVVAKLFPPEEKPTKRYEDVGCSPHYSEIRDNQKKRSIHCSIELFPDGAIYYFSREDQWSNGESLTQSEFRDIEQALLNSSPKRNPDFKISVVLR